MKKVNEGTTEGENHRGRPRLNYMKQIMRDMNFDSREREICKVIHGCRTCTQVCINLSTL